MSAPAPGALSDEDAASASFAAPDDDVPIGPSEEEESAYLAEEAASGYGRGAGFGLSAAEGEPEATFAGPLPSLASLQEKISPATLALIDELFRAKFTRVQRVHAKDLKS
ncbi:hypothetical protein AXK11_03695 [Cephaloticoccus primus]|uniref:Uncharacterized protein n=1 Tax=Cephaloticoccus primus TaxID=1548207 RepID=A0A139SPV7_9BACT|nr:hypothetical protein [Cephaloticoccus primus]KXU36645.1 hypothetical protein AXK11_03695 [Cephaloticoccus primus]